MRKTKWVHLFSETAGLFFGAPAPHRRHPRQGQQNARKSTEQNAVESHVIFSFGGTLSSCGIEYGRDCTGIIGKAKEKGRFGE
jgi:hypothetical protein